MKAKAYGKVNLSLNVVKKRGDGYHELEMIMVPINLYDELTFKIADQMIYECSDDSLVFDDNNTIVKAIKLMRDKYKFTNNFHIKLKKNIPMQAGLAGGSSNAAITLRLVNELLNLNCSETELYELGKKIGADVAFCLYEKPALVTGVGDIIKPLDINIDFYLLLVKPREGISTKEAFQKLDFSNIKHPDYRKVAKALSQGDYDDFINSIGNSLEEGAFKLMPNLVKLKQELIDYGFDMALMSGSGSTVFGISKDALFVEQASEYFSKNYEFVRMVKVKK